MFRILAEGDYACFSRPELKVERVTYDIITPSAAVGLIRSVYWHPGLDYHITKIYMLNPINYISIKRNEVSKKISGANVVKAYNGNEEEILLSTNDSRQQRTTLMLKNVKYIIEGYITINKQKASPSDNLKKFYEILTRRLKNGQNYYQGFLGYKEFPAKLSLYEKDIENEKLAYSNEVKDLGYMLHSLDYNNPAKITPRFFKATLDHGVLNVTESELLK